MEFVDGMAEASATGQYGPGRVAADIIGRADLKLGERVKPVLEALQAASPNRLRGLRHSVGWNPPSEVEDRELHEKCEADPIIGSTCPSAETNGIWIKKEFKPNCRPLESEEDDVVDLWSEQPDGPFDHERFKTWTVLAHVADEVMDRYAFLDPSDHHHQK